VPLALQSQTDLHLRDGDVVMGLLHGPHSDLTGKIDRLKDPAGGGEEPLNATAPRAAMGPLAMLAIPATPLVALRAFMPPTRPAAAQAACEPPCHTALPCSTYGMHLHHVFGQCRLCNATVDVLLALQQSACPGRFISG
jgi:hypothetical protein